MIVDKVYFESRDYLVLYKPADVPSVPLKVKAGGTFLESVAKVYPEVLTVHGKNEWEGSAIHRLDTKTRGLMLFARNQESYDWILSEQANERVIKEYRAVFSKCRAIDNGFEPFPYGNIIENGGVISSRFRAYGPKSMAVRPTLTNPRFQSGRVYSTEVIPESSTSVICKLTLGFRHQIRAHLAWAGYPLVGDSLYGGEESAIFGLEAIGICFRTKEGQMVRVSSEG